jgi:hypothetical protein
VAALVDDRSAFGIASCSIIMPKCVTPLPNSHGTDIKWNIVLSDALIRIAARRTAVEKARTGRAVCGRQEKIRQRTDRQDDRGNHVGSGGYGVASLNH